METNGVKATFLEKKVSMINYFHVVFDRSVESGTIGEAGTGYFSKREVAMEEPPRAAEWDLRILD